MIRIVIIKQIQTFNKFINLDQLMYSDYSRSYAVAITQMKEGNIKDKLSQKLIKIWW